MKNLFVAIAISICSFATQAAEGDYSLTLHTVSKHSRGDYNEVNKGIALGYQYSETVSFQAGRYHNSEGTYSNYLMVEKSFYNGTDLAAGVFGGVVTGYRRAPDGTLGAGLFAEVGLAKSTALKIRLLPPTPLTPAVVSLEIKYTL